MVQFTPCSRRTACIAVGTFLSGCLGDDEPEESDDTGRQGPMLGDRELSSAFPIILEDSATGDRVADVHFHGENESHWHRQPLTVPVADERVLVVILSDANQEEIELGESSEYSLQYIPDEGDESILTATVDGNELTLKGLEVGRARPRLAIEAPGGDRWETPNMLVDVESEE